MILNELTQLTGYNHSYAAQVLRRKELLDYLNISGNRVKYLISQRKRKKQKFYDEEVLSGLEKLWEEWALRDYPATVLMISLK